MPFKKKTFFTFVEIGFFITEMFYVVITLCKYSNYNSLCKITSIKYGLKRYLYVMLIKNYFIICGLSILLRILESICSVKETIALVL